MDNKLIAQGIANRRLIGFAAWLVQETESRGKARFDYAEVIMPTRIDAVNRLSDFFRQD